MNNNLTALVIWTFTLVVVGGKGGEGTFFYIILIIEIGLESWSSVVFTNEKIRPFYWPLTLLREKMAWKAKLLLGKQNNENQDFAHSVPFIMLGDFGFIFKRWLIKTLAIFWLWECFFFVVTFVPSLPNKVKAYPFFSVVKINRLGNVH